VLISLLLSPFENRLAFPGAAPGLPWEPPHPQLAVRELSFKARDGNVIHAWLTAPPGWRPEQGAILYSHGNGDNLSGWQIPMLLYRQHLGRAVLIYDYPGFGKSTGRPTERGGYAAIDAAHEWLINEAGVPAGQVILAGSSLGGAFATDLAARSPCRLLLLINTFTSFPDVAQHHFRYLPARWLVTNRMHNESKIVSVGSPVFVTHGRADRVVPFWMGERLHQRAGGPKRFFPIDDHPHAEPLEVGFFDAVRAFLDETNPK
jgi:fermentation-respiration switch protein FrsA (DUF1100 family)